MKEQKQEIDGIVVAELGNNKFTVDTEIGILRCHLNGRMVSRKIRIVVGSKVSCSVGAYDLTRGIIMKRLD